jgi:hypothetical protein
VTSEGHGEVRRLTPEGRARFAAPGICSPNCASHRGFGTFEGIVCRDIRHWRMIHGVRAVQADGSISCQANETLVSVFEVRYGADCWPLFTKALGDVRCRGR